MDVFFQSLAIFWLDFHIHFFFVDEFKQNKKKFKQVSDLEKKIRQYVSLQWACLYLYLIHWCVCVSLYVCLNWMSSTSVATQTFEKLIKKKLMMMMMMSWWFVSDDFFQLTNKISIWFFFLCDLFVFGCTSSSSSSYNELRGEYSVERDGQSICQTNEKKKVCHCQQKVNNLVYVCVCVCCICHRMIWLVETLVAHMLLLLLLYEMRYSWATFTLQWPWMDGYWIYFEEKKAYV